MNIIVELTRAFWTEVAEKSRYGFDKALHSKARKIVPGSIEEMYALIDDLRGICPTSSAAARSFKR